MPLPLSLHPWPRSRAVHLQSLYLAFFTAGGEGLAVPGWERSTSLRRDCGQLECTEELLRARQDQARPAPHRGLSGQAFMETWSSAPGAAGPCILPLPGKAGWRSRGGQAGGQEEMALLGMGGGTRAYWEISPSYR